MARTCAIHEGARTPCSRCAKVGEVNRAAADELGTTMRAKRAPVRPSAEHLERTTPTPMQGWRRRRRVTKGAIPEVAT